MSARSSGHLCGWTLFGEGGWGVHTVSLFMVTTEHHTDMGKRLVLTCQAGLSRAKRWTARRLPSGTAGLA